MNVEITEMTTEQALNSEAASGIDNSHTKVNKNSTENTSAVAEEMFEDEASEQSASQSPPIYLSAMIDLSADIPEPVPILKFDDKIIFSRGNISAIGGKAKSRKTFLTVLQTSEILAGNGKVVIIDTEMAVAHVCETARRVHRLMGWDTQQNNDRLKVLSLREYSITERKEILQSIIADLHPEIVFLDGLRDLVKDFNNPTESAAVINLLMKLTTLYNCHICNVLHKNKGDANLRGHLGTELINKSETVLSVTDMGNNISSVEPVYTRNLPFDEFTFCINDDGLPEYCDPPASSAKQTFDKNEKKHQMFEDIFSDTDTALLYTDLCNRIIEAENISERTAKRRISEALEAGIIVKGADGKYSLPREAEEADVKIITRPDRLISRNYFNVIIEDVEPLVEEEPITSIEENGYDVPLMEKLSEKQLAKEEPPPTKVKPEWGVGECPF